jgi:hypothetical protein
LHPFFVAPSFFFFSQGDGTFPAAHGAGLAFPIWNLFALHGAPVAYIGTKFHVPASKSAFLCQCLQGYLTHLYTLGTKIRDVLLTFGTSQFGHAVQAILDALS